MYRGFIKNITNLTGNALGSADLRIQSMTIKRDILSKATSQFTVIAVPDAAEVGNVFGVYDDYGSIIYLGVITGISATTIETDQIVAIFDDKWLWNDPSLSTIEATIASILATDFQGSTDTLMASIWSQYSITTSSTTSNNLPTHENNYVTNFMDFVFSLYENYDILLDISIPYSTGTPTIDITKNTSTALKLGNNTYALRNFVIDRETAETNKLVIYSKDGSRLRRTFYATTSGVTSNSASLNRLPKINTVYRFSDDDVADIIASDLPTQMYNHKITCELVLGNKLYDFDDFTLGRQCDIFFNGEYYYSILTGYELTIDDQGKAEKVKLVFGKVRYSLEKKLYAESNKDNIATSNYAFQSGNAKQAEVTVPTPSSGTIYYPAWVSSASNANQTLNANDGLKYLTRDGTTTQDGYSGLRLGNTTNSGTDGNRWGFLDLYPPTGAHYGRMRTVNTMASDSTYTFPNMTGDVVVVETGTDGDWTYRKYSDGIAECWLNVEHAASSWSSWGSGLYYNGTFTTPAYPTNLFVSIPSVTTGLQKKTTDGNGLKFLATSTPASATSYGSVRIIGANTKTETFYITIHAIGRWQ